MDQNKFGTCQRALSSPFPAPSEQEKQATGDMEFGSRLNLFLLLACPSPFTPAALTTSAPARTSRIQVMSKNVVLLCGLVQIIVASLLAVADASFVSVLPAAGSNMHQSAKIPARKNVRIPHFMTQSSDGEGKAEDEEEGLVTKEMFMRDLLEDPKVKRKKKGGSRYKTLDNRDALPFVVKVVTPDPYTPAAVKRKEALKNTKKDREKNSSKKKKKQKQKRQNLVGMDQSGITSSLYTQNKDGSLQKVLGEFQLDKSTNCGDIIEVGEQVFEVQTARCQYKYAGGRRFVMCRKILEVKDVTRVADEATLLRQLHKSDSLDDSQPPPLE